MAAPPLANVAAQYGAALTYLQSYFGWIVNEVESYPTLVGQPATPGSPLVTANADRLALLFANFNSNQATIGLVPSQVANGVGIPLTAGTGVVSMVIKDDLTLVSRAWFGTAQTGPQTIYVLEIIGIRQLPFRTGG